MQPFRKSTEGGQVTRSWDQEARQLWSQMLGNPDVQEGRIAYPFTNHTRAT